MDCTLTKNEARVLGSLIEKGLTTPEYYPLTLNAVVAACNQKSNREPVMTLSAEEAEEAIEGLRTNQLAWRRHQAGARVPKFEHNGDIKYHLTPQETAALCVLLLRGPQTVGEIRGRTQRMFPFESLDEVTATLTDLMEKENGPFVKELPRQPGRKECRYQHLFFGESEIDEVVEVAQQPTDSTVEPSAKGRIEILEEELTNVKEEVAELRAQFEKFKSAFE